MTAKLRDITKDLLAAMTRARSQRRVVEAVGQRTLSSGRKLDLATLVRSHGELCAASEVVNEARTDVDRFWRSLASSLPVEPPTVLDVAAGQTAVASRREISELTAMVDNYLYHIEAGILGLMVQGATAAAEAGVEDS